MLEYCSVYDFIIVDSPLSRVKFGCKNVLLIISLVENIFLDKKAV